MKINLLKREKNVNLNQQVISFLSGNPAECKSLLNIMPLDSRVKPENDREVGRSMVEMLGVLAVMGVLSVAGIAGYTTAMRSYRTNEALNAASMLYIMAMAQNAGNGPTANVGMSNIGSSDPSGATLSFNATNKNIIITFNDEKDCTMAKNKLGDKASGECPSLSVTFNNDSDANTIEAIAEKLMKLKKKNEDLQGKRENLEDWYADNCEHNFCAPNCPTEEECENKKNEIEELKKEIEEVEKEAEELIKGKEEEIEEYLAIEDAYQTRLADGWSQADADEYKRLSQRILELRKQLDSDTSISTAEEERLAGEIEDLEDAIVMLDQKYYNADADLEELKKELEELEEEE